MKIRNIKNNRTDTVTYKEWKDEYINTGLYKDYEITDYFSVVELHRLKKDGTRSMTFMEKQNALETQIQFPNEFRIKELSFNGYNKWLIKDKNQSFLFIKSWYNLPAIKQRLEIITKSKISKEAWFIIRGIAIIVIASIIIATLK